MKLTEDQVAFYNENGYLKLENYFSEEELECLVAEYPKTVEKDSPRVILEDNGEVRSVFAPHMVNACFDRLSRLDRFVRPSEQLVGHKLYLHQYKVNTKKGFKGDWWEWHQDFPYWHLDDGIQKPDMISVLMYLQDADAANGALLLIPKSHKNGIVKFADKDPETFKEKLKFNEHIEDKQYLSSLNSNIKFTVEHELVRKMAVENGIITAGGKRGTVLFFHGNIFHASNVNLTPFDRDAIIITYNSVNNKPENKQAPRPEYLAGRNYAPIEALVKTVLPEEGKA
jgi:ectoine hydroxylase